MDIRTILTPVDFSTCSLLAMRQAASLAARLEARLLVLYVSDLPTGMNPKTLLHWGGTEQTAEKRILRDVDANLEAFLAIAREHKVDAMALTREGPITEAILETAKERKADLIFMGTHGRSGLARMVLGSVAESVLRQSHVPVMVVRRETRPECARESCDWCLESGRSQAEERILDEQQG